jgi:type I restriction enzyme S subunit
MIHDKQNNRPNVPPLRFPEFTEPWERRKLSEFATKITKKNRDNTISNVLSNSATLGIVQQSQYFEREIVTDENLNGYYVINKDDFVYNPRKSVSAPCGPVNKYDGKESGIISPLYLCFTVNNINRSFLLWFFKSPKWYRYIYLNGDSGVRHDRVSIKDDLFLDMPITIPLSAEQEKISKLFELIDRRIAVQSGLIEKLESLISGITLSVVKSNDCESVRLSELLTERNEVNTAQYEVYSVSVSQGVVNQVDYLGRSFAAKDTSNYNVVHYGDIVYTKSPTGDFPYGIVKRSGQTDPVAVSPLYGVYKPASNEIGCFLHYYFCNPVSAKNYLHKLIQKGAKNTINITNQRFLENTIKVPKAEKLTIVVKLLNQISAKKQHAEELLTYYRKQKQYLLSQMFI